MCEHLDRTALVGGDCHGVGVLLDGSAGDLVAPSVVTEVDDLAALALQDPAENADRHVMAIKDGRGCDHTQGHATARGTGDVPRYTLLSTTNHGDSDPTGPNQCADWPKWPR